MMMNATEMSPTPEERKAEQNQRLASAQLTIAQGELERARVKAEQDREQTSNTMLSAPAAAISGKSMLLSLIMIFVFSALCVWTVRQEDTRSHGYSNHGIR